MSLLLLVLFLKITVFCNWLLIKVMMPLVPSFISGTSVPHEQLLPSSFNLFVGRKHKEAEEKCDQTLPFYANRVFKLL